jgi:hypothetical protein
MLKRSATLALVVLAASLLAVGLALPASAQQTPATFSGPVTAGQTITVTCPEGHQVQLEGGAPNAGVTYYRNVNRKVVLPAPSAPTSFTATTASWTVPKGAKYADATAYCVPIATQLVTLLGQATGNPVTVNCPAETPYLVSVQNVLQLDPTIGQLLSTPYTATATGVIVDALPPSFIWRVEMTCSSAPLTG